MRAFIIFLALLLSGCTTYQVSTTGHDPIYAVNVPSNINIDTLNYRQFQWKLRTDFQFRFDFARYAMNQPYSWYMSNFNFNRWRPYNSFDIYFNSTQYWTNWAFNYPFHSNPYGWDNWNRPYSWGYSYSNWYNGPWSNQGYNAIWNRSRGNNVVYHTSRRSSNNVISKNIENNRVVTNSKPRINVEETRLEQIVTNIRKRIKTPTVRNIDNKIIPIINNNNNNSNPRVYVRPNNNNTIRINTRVVTNRPIRNTTIKNKKNN